MRRDPDYFNDDELDLVYIAKRLREALELEALLTRSGVDYLVETDKYSGGIIFRTERVGVFFYVRPQDAERTRQVMTDNRYRPYQPTG